MTDAGRFDESAFMKELQTLIDTLHECEPAVQVRRLLQEENPCGDDLVWYFTRPGCPFEVQVDPGIETLFLISTDEKPGYAEPMTVTEALGVVREWLHLNELSGAA